jgi:hypothetical protein
VIICCVNSCKLLHTIHIYKGYRTILLFGWSNTPGAFWFYLFLLLTKQQFLTLNNNGNWCCVSATRLLNVKVVQAIILVYQHTGWSCNRSIPDAFLMHSWCIPDAFLMHLKVGYISVNHQTIRTVLVSENLMCIL